MYIRQRCVQLWCKVRTGYKYIVREYLSRLRWLCFPPSSVSEKCFHQKHLYIPWLDSRTTYPIPPGDFRPCLIRSLGAECTWRHIHRLFFPYLVEPATPSTTTSQLPVSSLSSTANMLSSSSTTRVGRLPPSPPRSSCEGAGTDVGGTAAVSSCRRFSSVPNAVFPSSAVPPVGLFPSRQSSGEGRRTGVDAPKIGSCVWQNRRLAHCEIAEGGAGVGRWAATVMAVRSAQLQPQPQPQRHTQIRGFSRA